MVKRNTRKAQKRKGKRTEKKNEKKEAISLAFFKTAYLLF